jgi:diguanylate cyclase (GGDEF)-like protein
MVEYQKRLENQALVDPMTGLLNRRGFEKKMEEEFERTKRYLHPLSLLVIDVDDFKTINDMYGHLEGDNVLRKIAKCFSDKIRRSDFPARYGGEEFVVILSETEMAKALVVAQKIATEIKRCNFGPVTGPVSVSVSIGVSSISPGGEWPQWRQILEEADQALYRAKRNGKGRVECFCSGVIEKPNRELV